MFHTEVSRQTRYNTPTLLTMNITPLQAQTQSIPPSIPGEAPILPKAFALYAANSHNTHIMVRSVFYRTHCYRFPHN